MPVVGSVCIYEVFESLGYVLEICAVWMRQDTEVRPYDATVRVERISAAVWFSYIRQSGTLTATDHHNICLQLPATSWVWLLHDDEELRRGAVRGIEEFLNQTHDVGIVVGGVEDITYDGAVTRHWVPRVKETLRGDEGLLELGDEWKTRAPCQIFGKQESLESGGFQGSAGYPSDVAFACKLAHDYGVRFFRTLLAYPAWEHTRRRTSRPRSRHSGGSASIANRWNSFARWVPILKW